MHGLVNKGSWQQPVSLPMSDAVGMGVFARAPIKVGAPILQCRGKVTYDQPTSRRDNTHSVQALDTHQGTYWVRAQGQFSEVSRPPASAWQPCNFKQCTPCTDYAIFRGQTSADTN